MVPVTLYRAKFSGDQLQYHSPPFFTGYLVGKVGLEPTRLSALEPKSSASTNSATCPNNLKVNLFPFYPLVDAEKAS